MLHKSEKQLVGQSQVQGYIVIFNSIKETYFLVQIILNVQFILTSNILNSYCDDIF